MPPVANGRIIALMTAAAEFEVHMTVGADADLDSLGRFAAAREVKLTHIVLSHGGSPSQPMLTFDATGTLESVRERLVRLDRDLRASGFNVTRWKVEVPPWNAGVPATDADAVEDRYFEHHIKVLLRSGAEVCTLDPLVASHAARLSRNGRRVRADGREERFVTQRCYGVGRQTAHQRFSALCDALAGYEVLEGEQEYVVLDTNIGLDAGWISAGR
jgi:hypothetical protein